MFDETSSTIDSIKRGLAAHIGGRNALSSSSAVFVVLSAKSSAKSPFSGEALRLVDVFRLSDSVSHITQ